GCGEWASQFLVEDFVPGPEVALEGLLVEGRLQVLALFDKPDPLDGPYFEETIYLTPSRLPAAAQTAIAACAQEATRALGLLDGARYPGFIFARGDSPAEVDRALRAAHARLHFVL